MSGEDYFKQAEKKLGGWFFSDEDGAFELFQRAAGSFKAEQNYSRAGDAFMRAGDVAMKLKNPGDACSSYTECAKMFKRTDMSKAKAAMDMAVKLNIESNRLASAARLLDDWGDALCEGGRSEEALVVFRKAQGYYSAENQTQSANKMLGKIARALGDSDKWQECAEAYEELGKSQAAGPLKHQAKEQFFRALLCRVALVVPDNAMETVASARDSLEMYQAIDPHLRHTRELECMESIIDAVEDGDEDKYGDVTAQMDELRLLDDWKAHVMLAIKNNLSSTL